MDLRMSDCHWQSERFHSIFRLTLKQNYLLFSVLTCCSASVSSSSWDADTCKLCWTFKRSDSSTCQYRFSTHWPITLGIFIPKLLLQDMQWRIDVVWIQFKGGRMWPGFLWCFLHVSQHCQKQLLAVNRRVPVAAAAFLSPPCLFRIRHRVQLTSSTPPLLCSLLRLVFIQTCGIQLSSDVNEFLSHNLAGPQSESSVESYNLQLCVVRFNYTVSEHLRVENAKCE